MKIQKSYKTFISISLRSTHNQSPPYERYKISLWKRNQRNELSIQLRKRNVAEVSKSGVDLPWRRRVNSTGFRRERTPRRSAELTREERMEETEWRMEVIEAGGGGAERIVYGGK